MTSEQREARAVLTRAIVSAFERETGPLPDDMRALLDRIAEPAEPAPAPARRRLRLTFA